jgi:hypothetical protein
VNLSLRTAVQNHLCSVPQFQHFPSGTRLEYVLERRGWTQMRVLLIGLATLAAVLTLTPVADAFSGGGRGSGGDSGAFGTVGRGGNAGQNGGSGGNGGTFETAEPLAALVVGLGLLGARYLRRK